MIFNMYVCTSRVYRGIGGSSIFCILYLMYCIQKLETLDPRVGGRVKYWALDELTRVERSAIARYRVGGTVALQ